MSGYIYFLLGVGIAGLVMGMFAWLEQVEKFKYIRLLSESERNASCLKLEKEYFEKLNKVQQIGFERRLAVYENIVKQLKGLVSKENQIKDTTWN